MRRLATALTIDPEDLRASLLTLLLRVTLGLGVIVYVPSVAVAAAQGLYGVVGLDTAAMLAVLALAFAPLGHRWRASLFCLTCYGLGVGLLVSVGAPALIYLFGFSVVTVLLLGVRVGLGAVGLSSATLLVVGMLGHAAPAMAVPTWRYDLSGWLLVTGNFALIDLLMTLAVGAVLGTVERARERERAAQADRSRLLAQLQLQIERMPLAYILADRDFRFTRWNPAAERLFGFPEAEALGKHPFELIVPAAGQDAILGNQVRIKAGRMDAHHEVDNLTSDGRTITCEWHNTPLFDETGEFAGLLALGHDVTDRKKLEGQLRQSLKMEAVGQLAGGVAHDFNNLLSVVLGYADIVLAELGSTDPLRKHIKEIHAAGLRAAELTRQLLMFTRRQVVEPKVLDLNATLAAIEKMLARLVGEDVEISTVLDSSLGRVRIDPGSIEQVIVNLVVNARDAMVVGGKLTMETANVTLDEAYTKTHLDARPGDYVMLSVTDTGTGMDAPTLARIFEPYFTTKEIGKGTGLGLSTVFGVVQQNGGSIWVSSELGLGTTFKVYLPRVDAVADVAPALPPRLKRTGCETILLVEDEDRVRELARDILQRHGYRVLIARSAGEALLACEQHTGPIHLLLTDIVMPQMGGPALAKRIAALRPEMRVLFMSGYTDDAAVRHGVILAEVAYLQKPLTIESLTSKVRGVLDQ